MSFARKQLFKAKPVFSQYDLFAESTNKCATLLPTQVRQISQLGRVKVNITKPVNKVLDLLHPVPEEKYKKFKKSKIWVNNGQSKQQIAETSAKLNPKGTQKPQKISERSKELIAAIFDAAERSDPVAAIEAYQRLSATPDVPCYTALIKSMEKDGDFLGEAIQIYQDMKKLRIPMNVTTFQALVNCCVAAKHWQRAMFFVKEMTQLVNLPKSATKETCTLFTTVLQLLHEQALPHRIAAIYQVMQQYNLVPDSITKQPDNDNYTVYPTIPLAFVKMFIANEQQAASYWKQTLLPAINPEHEEEELLVRGDSVTLSLLPQYNLLDEMIQANNNNATTANPHHFLETNMSNAAFRGYLDDPLANAAMKNTFEMYYDQVAQQMEQELKQSIADNNAPALPHIHGLKREQVKELMPQILAKRKELNEQLAVHAMDVQKMRNLVKEHKASVKQLVDEKLTLVKWDPVIIGVDGKPFFPKNITFSKVTADTVLAAKREYLNHVQDAQAFKEIEADLHKRVKLCWYERETGKLVEGLYY